MKESVNGETKGVWMKTLLKAIILIPCSAAIGTVVLLLVYLLPTDTMQQHIFESSPVFQREGTYYTLVDWCTSQHDNFTDALMLLTAGYEGEGSLLDRAMSNYSCRVSGKNPAETLMVYGDDDVQFYTQEYSRYWHGYLSVLKPFLIVTNYSGIRVINQYFQLAISICAVTALYRRRKVFALPFVLLLLSLSPITTGHSLQFSTVYSLSIIAAIVVLKKSSQWDLRQLCIFFTLIGIVVNYFDFLTYPLLSFGVPICVYCLIRPSDRSYNSIALCGTCFMFWGIGYGGMWASKWIVGTLLTQKNVIDSALYSVVFRSSHSTSTQSFTLATVLKRNYESFIHNPAVMVELCALLIALILAVRAHAEKKWVTLGAGLFVAAMPLLWYMILANHSYVHFWFTYRNMCLIPFSMFCAAISILSRSKKDRLPGIIQSVAGGK